MVVAWVVMFNDDEGERKGEVADCVNLVPGPFFAVDGSAGSVGSVGSVGSDGSVGVTVVMAGSGRVTSTMDDFDGLMEVGLICGRLKRTVGVDGTTVMDVTCLDAV